MLAILDQYNGLVGQLIDREPAARTASVRALLETEGLAAIVLGMPANVLWLSGFDMVGTFYFTAVVVAPDDAPALLVHRAEVDMARAGSRLDEIAAWGHGQDPVDVLGDWLETRVGPLRGRRLGVELDEWLRPRDLDHIADRLGVTWADVGPAVEAQRSALGTAALARSEDAGRVADMTIAAAAAAVVPRTRETAVAAAGLRTYTLAGGQEPAVPLSVRSGPRMRVARGMPADRRIEAGEGVALEVWASLGRCAATAGTTVAAGHPSPELIEAWEAVDAIFAAIESHTGALAGSALWEVADAACRRAGALLAEPVGFGLAHPFPLRSTTSWAIASRETRAVGDRHVVCVAPTLTGASGAVAFAARTYRVGDGSLVPITHRPQLWVPSA